MPPAAIPSSVRTLLLVRRGILSVDGVPGSGDPDRSRAFALELAELGYVPSAKLQRRLDACPVEELTRLHHWVIPALSEHAGGNQRHEPLFRSFPDGIPTDTTELWWAKVLVHFCQQEGQPCLWCSRVGTTHVLTPCRHVVCDRCFDGARYSACPACERQVDRNSPFFLPSLPRGKPHEQVRFRVLDLCGDSAGEGAAWFQDLCRRTQALSPDDRHVLTTIVAELGMAVMALVPETIPVRENVAAVFGTLLAQGDPATVLPVASRHLKTATDVLRLIAVHSGTDGSLQGETIFKVREQVAQPGRFWGLMAKLLGGAHEPQRRVIQVPLTVHRFTVAKMSRRLRRALLTLLEGMEEDRLTEDLLRHRSYWVWVGEFLHPHEYAKRFPKVARAFQVVRGQSPGGVAAPPYRTWNSRVAQAVEDRNGAAHLAALLERPGEFARRLDHALRLVQADGQAIEQVAETFIAALSRFATPVLVTLRSHLPLRTRPSPRRVYWPKGAVATGVFDADRRTVLPAATVERLVQAITGELLRRFAAKPAFDRALIDAALSTVILPFNERTASPAAVTLPRGSVVAVPAGRITRMFLHWCQPETGGETTDIDLSVAFYDAEWRYVGVCSYYQLQARGEGGALIAQSAGDLRDAPLAGRCHRVRRPAPGCGPGRRHPLRGDGGQQLRRHALQPARARLRRDHAEGRRPRQPLQPSHRRPALRPPGRKRRLHAPGARRGRGPPALARRPRPRPIRLEQRGQREARHLHHLPWTDDVLRKRDACVRLRHRPAPCRGALRPRRHPRSSQPDLRSPDRRTGRRLPRAAARWAPRPGEHPAKYPGAGPGVRDPRRWRSRPSGGEPGLRALPWAEPEQPLGERPPQLNGDIDE